MKGTNKMLLNEATVMEAVQEWVNRRMGEHAPKVEGIKWNDNDDYFDVTVSERVPSTVAGSREDQHGT